MSTDLRSLIIGLVVAAWLVSLVSGGYVYYVNGILVGLLADPVLVVIVRLVVVAGLLWLVAGLMRAHGAIIDYYGAGRPRPGFWPRFGLWLGLILSAFLIVYGAGSTGAILFSSFVLAPLMGYAYSRILHRNVWLVVGLVMVVSSLVIPLYLYEPVASSRHISVTYTESMISVNGFKRFIPLMTAYVYASDRVQSPVHRIYPGDSYVYYNGSHSIYNWVVEPEGLWNELTKRPLGVVFVYGDEYPPRVRFVEHHLAWGLHNKRFLVFLVDELKRHIMLSCGLQYKPLLEDNMEILYHGRIYILVPLETWRRGLLYSLPVLAGYAVVGESGNITCIPANKLGESLLMKGLPLLPEKIARDWVEAYRYSVGFIAFYFYHNTYVIRDVGTNPQPYLEQGSDGKQYWVFVAEPAGRTYSAKYIIYIDSEHTGEPRILMYRLPRPVIGVSKVASYVKQAHPTFDWSQLSIQEPMPTILGNNLYWKVTVTTKDYRGLVSIDVVNAATGEVRSMRPTGAITYLEAMNTLLLGKQAKPGPKSIAEKINELEKRIDQMIQQLTEMKKELEELRQQLATNETK